MIYIWSRGPTYGVHLDSERLPHSFGAAEVYPSTSARPAGYTVLNIDDNKSSVMKVETSMKTSTLLT